MEQEELESIEDHYIHEFDRNTCVSLVNDGSVQLKVPLMPPSWPCADGAFDSFEDRLSEALGVRVEGLDKELFSIPSPTPDTIAHLKEHLLTLREKYELK
jgi:hypothetical protein